MAAALLCAVGLWAQVTDVSNKLVASGTNWPTFTADGPWQGANNKDNTSVKGACTLADFKFAEVYYDKTTGTKYTVSQTVTDLDNGIYKFRIAAFARKENIWGDDNQKTDANNVRLKANNSSTYITSNVMAYYELVTEVTDGTLTISISGVDDTNKSNWMGYTDASLVKLFSGSSYPADVTGLITNWDFTGCENDNFPGWTISAASGSNTWKNGDTRVEYWKSVASEGSFDYYQILTGLPTGRYTLSASMWNSTDGISGSVNGECGVYGTSGGITKFKGVTIDSNNSDLHTYTTDEIVVTDGVLRLGVKNNETMGARWFGVDWIKLNYVGPVVASGTYYLYDNDNKVFASRGANYATRFTVDKYGIPVKWDNWSQRLQLVDNNDYYLFFDNTPASSWIYTDKADNVQAYTYFAFVPEDGSSYYLRDNNQTTYVKNDGSTITVTSNQAEATKWLLKNQSEHDVIVGEYPTDNKEAVITAASLSSETNAAGFVAWLAANCNEENKTSEVGTATFNGEAGDWTWTATRENFSNSAINYGTGYAEAFQRSGDWTQTISGLDNGIYKVTVDAFERASTYEICNALGTEFQPVTSYFEANGQKVLLKSWYSEKTGTNNPNDAGEAVTAFNNNKYDNEVYAYVYDGTLTLKLVKPSCMWGSWVIFNNVTLTRYYQTEATMTVNADAKYATFCAPFAVTIPSGVTAYNVTGVTGDVLDMGTVSTTIPANKPVVLYAASGLSATTFKGKAVDGTPANGLLTGTYTDNTPVPADSYVLLNQGGKVAFYHVSADKNVTVDANRAYLTLPTLAKERAFYFNTDVTGIDAISALTSGGYEGIYTMDGVKVDGLQRGINIVKMKSGVTRKVFLK